MNVHVGDVAPDFTLSDHAGESWSLHDQRGKRVVLYFYAKDGTSGCTTQARDLRDRSTQLSEAGAVVVGVSTDDQASHADFRTEHDLPQALLVDVDAAITRRYGAWGPKLRDGVRTEGVVRSTVVLAADGRVAAVLSPVTPEDHADQVLAALAIAG